MTSIKLKLLQWLWALLPDKCEVEDCCRKGMRGNENRIYPFKDNNPYIDYMTDFYIVMCDYCTMRYNRGEVLNAHGSLPRLICHPKKGPVDFERKRKEAKIAKSIAKTKGR